MEIKDSTGRLIGSITKVLWDCAEVSKIDPYLMWSSLEFSDSFWMGHDLPKHTKEEYDEAAKYANEIIEIMLDVRVGNRVYINDKLEGVIGGVIVEETEDMIVVKFDRPPKVGSEVYI